MSEQIASAIAWAQQRIEAVSDTAKLDAELLLAHSLEKPRSYLYSWPEKELDDSVWQTFRQLVERRLKPTPVAYLLIQREFFSLDFMVSPAVLIPRPETELLVEISLGICRKLKKPQVLEMGTGSGIISIVLLKEKTDIDLLTTDISADCLDLAKANAQRHKVQLNCLQSSWYSNLPKQAVFDLIVSNPPYIAAEDPYLGQGDLPAEPIIALTPGLTGLEAIEEIISGASNYLKSGGFLVFEHGYDQADIVTHLLQDSGFINIKNHIDFNDQPRVSLGQKP